MCGMTWRVLQISSWVWKR